MRSHPQSPEFQRARHVRVMPPAADALNKRMHDAVAWRAFHLYEARGCASGHEAEDWREAEADVVRPLECGTIVEEDTVCVTTDASCFGPGSLEVWVEPHRITLCGPCAAQKLERPAEAAIRIGQRNWIFRTHELTAELDPAEVIVKFNGPAMHIYISRAHRKPQQAELAHAA
jgi:Protein of unknown function (DUF2934)